MLGRDCPLETSGRIGDSRVIAGLAMAGANAVGIDIFVKGLSKDDVPFGTEVWSVDEPEIG
jgi:hypothetical protein